MKTETTGKTEKTRKIHPANGKIDDAAKKVEEKVEVTVEALLPKGSLRRLAAGVAAAAVGGLWVAAWVGAGPAAIAGTAGYLAYRKLHEERRLESSVKH